MRTPPRSLPKSRLVVPGLLVAGLVAGPGPAVAAAQDETPAPSPSPAAEQPAEPAAGSGTACAATGYLVESDAELAQLQEELADRGLHRIDGVPLDREQTWLVPDGSRPVVVLDAAAPVLADSAVSVSLAGQHFQVASNTFEEPRDRYVSTVDLPHLGPTIRSLGLTVASEPCQLELALSVDRSLWTTLVGLAGVGLAILGGLLAVLVGRLRKGGWLRRFGFAAPFGLLAGVGLAAVLLEAGVVSPFANAPWWPTVAGLGLAAVLPLTRWRPRGARPGAAGVPPEAWPAPTHAPLGGYRLDQGVAGSEFALLYRATRVRVDPDPGGFGQPAPAGEERALVKVVRAERYGEPAARLRMDREAAALSGPPHPNLLQLRETLIGAPRPDGGTGPPTLVFEDVPGAPLRRLFVGGGGLSGPQAVSVVLGVLAGLGALHARGLVHRDLRPEHVWLAVNGSVRLGGCELAVAGVEHPVAAEGAAPYASPEQLAGRVLDPRSDLWASGVLLAELLTGQARPDPVGLPEPLALVLARAVAADPADRPATAEQLAAELREAAGQAFGAGWAGAGALTGAVIAQGAVGAAAGGYALAGAAGLGAGAGAAGLGAGTAGLGAAGAAAGTGTGTLGAAGGPAAGSVLAGAASSVSPVVPSAPAGVAGPAGAVVNSVVAVLAGAVIGLGVVLVEPEPAQADPVLVTPEQARVIFLRTVTEGQDDRFTHFEELAEDAFADLLEEDESIEEAPLTEVQVGVPADQREHPIWFVASALMPFEDGTASVFARFDRESADEPWLMTRLLYSTERLLPGPLLDEDGWLAPPPAVVELLADPEELPERYHEWLVRANEAGKVGSDELLTLRFDDSGMIVEFTDDVPFFAGDDPGPFSYEYEMSVGEVVTDLIPLVDGTVQVTFTSVIRLTTYNTPDRRGAPCDQFSLHWTNNDPPGDFRWLAQDLVIQIEAWIPVLEQAPEPTPAPSATPTRSAEPTDEEAEEEAEEDEEPAELELEPIDPEDVAIEDWEYLTDNRDGEPC